MSYRRVYSDRGHRAVNRVRLIWCQVFLFWLVCCLFAALLGRVVVIVD